MKYKGMNFHLFGDSVAKGYLLTYYQNRWSYKLCERMGMVEQNYAISGSTLEKRSPINYGGSTYINMVDRISEIPVFNPSTDALLVFAYGLNDWGQNGTNYTTANFITDYTTILNAANAKGWVGQSILILSPTHATDVAAAAYDGLTHNGSATQQRLLDFVQACKQVSINFSTRFFDCHKPFTFLTNPISLLFPDQIHLNESGSEFIANLLYCFLAENKYCFPIF